MNKLQQSIAVSILAATLSVAATGCWYAVAGVGAYAGYRYVDGEYKGVIRADLDNSIKATRAAFEDLEIREKSFEESNGSATITGVSGGNRDVTVKLGAAGDDATNARVRVDTFGDESFGQLVMEKINDNI